MAEADAVAQVARPRLLVIAYRVLGSPAEADDVVQEAWIRWQATDRSAVRDVAAFLATITTLPAINFSQSVHSRRETSIEAWLDEPVDPRGDPALTVERTETIEIAVSILLQRSSPGERAAYLLREAFDYPYGRIAALLALSEAQVRQLVTRARRRVTAVERAGAGGGERQPLLEAFIAAAQEGDLPSGASGSAERDLVEGVRRHGGPALVRLRAPAGMRRRGDEPLRVAEEKLWIERVLRVSLTTVILSGVTVAAAVALFWLLS